MAWTDQIVLRRSQINDGPRLTLLIWCFLVLLCVSMVLVSRDVSPSFNLRYDHENVLRAALSIGVFCCCVPLLVNIRGIFGFSASFYLLSVTAGYLWLSYFTPLRYDHSAARLFAIASWVAFAVPSLLITQTPTIRGALAPHHMHLLCSWTVVLSAGIAALGYSSGFHIVGFVEGESLRGTLSFPTWLRYGMTISTGAVLPFCYAWFFTQKRYLLAVTALVVALSYYPIALNKTALLTPFWLIFITVLLKLTSCRTAVILSLLVPMLLGLASQALNQSSSHDLIFRVINFRMLAIPSSAIDHYNHFFSTHSLTNFCQITFIGKLFDCALPDQLGTILAHEYATGNYNASLLATEGIASVGPYFAPLSALLCGILVAAGNYVSSRLDPSFVFLSAGALLQGLMNVPLSTILLTHGGGLLLLLWALTPASETDENM